MQFMEVERVTL